MIFNDCTGNGDFEFSVDLTNLFWRDKRRACALSWTSPFKLNLHNTEGKNYIKYLGIYIPHIHHINSKISKNLGILFRLRHFLTLNTLKQIHYSLIYPNLHYGIMSCGNTYPSRLTKVQTKKNKCIRCMFFSYNRESSASYLKLLDILNIDIAFLNSKSPC